MILIYGNQAWREQFAQMDGAEQQRGLQAYADLTDSLSESGELVATAPLADPSRSARVSVSEGRVAVTDGPFAEVKEFLTGFYLVDCDSRERALQIAGRIPEADVGLVEVRPTMDLESFTV